MNPVADDTFRILSRTPFMEMQKILAAWGAEAILKNEYNTTNRTNLLENNGWNIVEFHDYRISHRINKSPY